MTSAVTQMPIVTPGRRMLRGAIVSVGRLRVIGFPSIWWSYWTDEIVLAGPLTLDNVVMNIDGSLNWQSGDIEGTDGSIVVGAEGNLTVDQAGGRSLGVNLTIQGSATWIEGDIALAGESTEHVVPRDASQRRSA